MRERIQAVEEIAYPNRGGYTGFSIFIWETNNKIPVSYSLMDLWGSAEYADRLKASRYVIEGRFFVFGSLLDRVFVGKNSHREVLEIRDKLFDGWKPIMDKLNAKELELMSDPKRGGVYIDEIVNAEIKDSIVAVGSKRII